MLLTRVTIRKWVSAAFGTAIIAAPVLTNAQITVRSVVVGERSVTDTERVQLARFADSVVEKKIAVGTTLQVGDLISTVAPNANVLLEVGCPAEGGTVFRFSGAFRVIVLPPRPDVRCVLQLLAGGVDVMAEEPTEINAGGIVLGSKGTQYAVHLRRTEDGPVCEGVVYENDLLIKTSQKEIPLSTSRGWVFNFATATGKQGDISEGVLKESATIASRFDVARLRADSVVTPVTASEIARQESELVALHMEVLKAPANKDARLRLGRRQETVGSLDSARYNLKRGGGELIRKEAIKPQASVKTEEVATKAPAASAAMKSTTMTSMRVADPATRALELVRGGKPAEAVTLIRPRVDASSATARDYYALAEAYRALQDRAAARSAAERALAFANATTVLSAAELETLRAIVAGRQ